MSLDINNKLSCRSSRRSAFCARSKARQSLRSINAYFSALTPGASRRLHFIPNVLGAVLGTRRIVGLSSGLVWNTLIAFLAVTFVRAMALQASCCEFGRDTAVYYNLS